MNVEDQTWRDLVRQTSEKVSLFEGQWRSNLLLLLPARNQLERGPACSTAGAFPAQTTKENGEG